MWGATIFARGKTLTHWISIHAPMWGATGDILLNVINHTISIHAPMWGATVVFTLISPIDSISIHAPMWGATFVSSTVVSDGLKFQSTHPCGVRLGKKWYLRQRKMHFNPRTHVGCD